MKTKQIDIFKCKKISILGPSGSGKSTLAIKLGQSLDLPITHIDMLYWKPNWERTEKKDLNKQVKKISKTKKWIIDGTYTVTLKNRFKRSHLVIFLDYSEEFCINSVLDRFKKGKANRVGLATDLNESKEGLKDLIAIIKDYFKNKRPKVLKLLNKYAKNKHLIFKTREELNLFVENLQNS